MCRDARRRWKKWPKGVPTASPSRYFPLYASLLETWNITRKHIFSKSEIHGLGTSRGYVISQPGTALRRKQRVVVCDDLSSEEFRRRKDTAESKMTDRCMGMLEMLGFVKTWKRRGTREPGPGPGKPERRWRLCQPRKSFCEFAQLPGERRGSPRAFSAPQS